MTTRPEDVGMSTERLLGFGVVEDAAALRGLASEARTRGGGPSRNS